MLSYEVDGHQFEFIHVDTKFLVPGNDIAQLWKFLWSSKNNNKVKSALRVKKN